jgi:hypothetical protein
MLALHGDVFTGRTATAVDCSGPLPRVEVKGLPAPLRAGRVLDARGFGDPAGSAAADGKLIMTAPQWMAGMDASFPLQGLRRVAVAGDGDYAKGVIESLFGMGPGTHHVTGLDRVERVDWYAPGLPTDCDAWRVTQRLRHARIGALLRGRRLKIIQSNARAVRSLDSVIVNGITYDCVIMATGWERKLLAGVPGASALDRTVGSPTVLARTTVEGTYYGLGPVAEIPFSALEARGAVGRLTGNRDAIFRLVNRTAALAMQLPAPVLVA